MEQRHRAALRKCRVRLIRDLKPTVVSHPLVELGLLTEGEEEEVRCQGTTQAKNEVILSCIPRKGPRAYEKFLGLLESLESQKSLAEELRKADELDGGRKGSRRLREKSPSSPQMSPTTIGGNVVAQESEMPMEASEEPRWAPVPSENAAPGGLMASQPVDTIPKFLVKSTVNLDDENLVYPMKHRPRGLSIVINNKNFHRKCRMNKRNGTDRDAETLDKLWTDLGFSNTVYHDVTKPQVEEYFSALAKRDHSNYDCVIVSVLTHGLDGGRIYTSDGEIASLEKLLSNFNADRAHPTLVGKPKLFFIQGCRGDDFDKATDVPDSGAADIARYLDQDAADGSELQSLPAQADMLIAYATTPGYVSWRNSEHGSWFIQAIDEVFRKEAYTEELCAMMVEVNRVVARDYEASGRHKQMPSPIIQLLKKLFFRPNYFVS
eukprot:scpid63703/ scgid4562/ Caspase-3; Caspase-3 subunit p17; Caspase-3 subunit p12